MPGLVYIAFLILLILFLLFIRYSMPDSREPVWRYRRHASMTVFVVYAVLERLYLTDSEQSNLN
jgi:hypothetical protein